MTVSIIGILWLGSLDGCNFCRCWVSLPVVLNNLQQELLLFFIGRERQVEFLNERNPAFRQVVDDFHRLRNFLIKLVHFQFSPLTRIMFHELLLQVQEFEDSKSWFGEWSHGDQRFSEWWDAFWRVAISIINWSSAEWPNLTPWTLCIFRPRCCKGRHHCILLSSLVSFRTIGGPQFLWWLSVSRREETYDGSAQGEWWLRRTSKTHLTIHWTTDERTPWLRHQINS